MSLYLVPGRVEAWGALGFLHRSIGVTWKLNRESHTTKHTWNRRCRTGSQDTQMTSESLRSFPEKEKKKKRKETCIKNSVMMWRVYTTFHRLKKKPYLFIFLVSFKHKLVRPTSTVTKSIFGIMIKWLRSCFFMAWEQISDGNIGFSRMIHVFLTSFSTVTGTCPTSGRSYAKVRFDIDARRFPVVRRAERITPNHFYI